MNIAGTIQGDLPGQVALREWVEHRASYWANPPYGPCTTEGCVNAKGRVLLGQDDPRCADCRSKSANRRQGEMSYPCDRCGKEAAFRDPAHRRDEYLCGDCHKDDGYEPTERSMLTKTQRRVGVTHSMGTKAVCIAAGRGTECKGEIKQRSSRGMLCNFHNDPQKYLKNKGS